jgi:hypothetical protein
VDEKQSLMITALTKAARANGTPVFALSPTETARVGSEFIGLLAESQIAAGRLVEAARMYEEHAAGCRKNTAALAAAGMLSPAMNRAIDLSLAKTLTKLAAVEADLERFPQALEHSADAVRIHRRIVTDEAESVSLFGEALTVFAGVRADLKTDLPNALDAVAELIGITLPQSGREHIAILTFYRQLGAQLLDLLRR